MTDLTDHRTPSPSNPSSSALRRHAIGAYGERVALAHLVGAGLVLLERNWRCPEGEIDLILREDAVLVICEVKTRTTPIGGAPHEAVTVAKVERMRRLAASWVLQRGVRPADIRLDLVAVYRSRRGAASVEHIRGIG